MTGLPAEAGNQNVDTRTERRVGWYELGLLQY
jgi:hypothetical protein